MTPGQVKKRYDHLRRKFFGPKTITGPGQSVPPTAKELTWVWAWEGADIWGATVFDEDEQPFELHLNEALLRSGMDWEIDRVLTHELTHMRLGPDRACSIRKQRDRLAKYWRQEQLRLTALGFRWL